MLEEAFDGAADHPRGGCVVLVGNIANAGMGVSIESDGYPRGIPVRPRATHVICFYVFLTTQQQLPPKLASDSPRAERIVCD